MPVHVEKKETDTSQECTFCRKQAAWLMTASTSSITLLDHHLLLDMASPSGTANWHCTAPAPAPPIPDEPSPFAAREPRHWAEAQGQQHHLHKGVTSKAAHNGNSSCQLTLPEIDATQHQNANSMHGVLIAANSHTAGRVNSGGSQAC